MTTNKKQGDDIGFELEASLDQQAVPKVIDLPIIEKVLESEKNSARKKNFGAIEVAEDLKRNQLSEFERKIYKGGMSLLKDVVHKTVSNVEKMVLTNPEVASGVVGIQPLTTLDTGESAVLYQALRRAGFNLGDMYSFFDFGPESTNENNRENKRRMRMLLNVPAAENTLRKYQKELGLSFEESKHLTKDEVTSHIQNLINGDDRKRAHLAHGLLSGFPLEDTQWWVQNNYVDNNLNLRLLQNPQEVLLNKINRNGKEEWHGTVAESILNPNNYDLDSPRHQLFPNTRAQFGDTSHSWGISGLGLNWMSINPPFESTYDHCQRLFQIDRETGYSNYIEEQRSTFDYPGQIMAINSYQDNDMDDILLTPFGKTLGGVAIGASILMGAVNAIDRMGNLE